MKAGYGCRLFGAHQALMGIKDGVVLLHSTVGCNFGTMGFHFTGCDMSDVRQTCTVLSDADVVFGGEESLRLALRNVRELYAPKTIFVITGCVSDMIQDDAAGTAARFREETGQEVLVLEAPGFRGSLEDGCEAAFTALAGLMEPAPGAEKPTVNILGPGADDFRLRCDISALRELLGDQVELHTVSGCQTREELRTAPRAGLNLVFGRGVGLAKEMEERFGIPWERLDYPYGLTGAKGLWAALSRHFPVDYAAAEEEFRAFTGRECRRCYTWIQALYGLPAAVLGTGARARGLAKFLSSELGMVTEVVGIREEYRDAERFYDRVRASEAAVLFGSSFEQDLADELGIPLVRFDFPVFDRVTLSDRPWVGPRGTLCAAEDILNEIIHARRIKGALYR